MSVLADGIFRNLKVCLFSGLVSTLMACGGGGGGGSSGAAPDTTPPIFIEVTPVATPTVDTTPSYTFQTNEAGGLTYSGSCTSTATLAVAGNNTITFSTLPAGTYSNCKIHVTDSAGNVTTFTVSSFTITEADTTAPLLATVIAVATPTNDTTPDFTFSSTEAGTITYDGSCSSVTTVASTGNNTVTLNTLTVGTYSNCTVKVTDAATNQSLILAIPSFTITPVPVVDTTAPTLSIVSAVPTPSNDTTPSFTFLSSEAGTITYGGSCSSTTTTVASSGNNVITLNALAAGTYSNCTVKVTDAADNASTNLAITSFTIDTTVPTLAVVTVVPTPTNDTTPNFTFNSTEAGTITYGGSCSSASTAASSGNNTVTFNTLTAGTYNDCTVKVIDSAGNNSALLAVNQFTILMPSPPEFSSLLPSVLVPGYEAKLSGSYLSDATVTINGAIVTPTVQTAHEIRFIAPSLTAGSYTMNIENIAGNINKVVSVKAKLVAQSMDAGNFSTCAVQVNGTVKCWGQNESGQLGNNSTTDSSLPVTVSGISTALKVSVGSDHSCAVLVNGTVRCWGSGWGLVPVTVSAISTATVVSVGGGYNCAVLANGTVQCWGWGSTATPVSIGGISTAVDVSTDGSHTCAVLSGGTIKCWGSNASGELGNNSKINSSVPVSVSGISSAVDVSATTSRTCAVLADGTARCWGSNIYGQLGNNSTTDSLVPVPLSGVTGAISIDTAEFEERNSTCVVLESGDIQCRVDGSDGNSDPHGNTNDMLAAIEGITTATGVSIGEGHTCAQLGDGSVQCWGVDECIEWDTSCSVHGNQLTRSNLPVTVSGISTAIAMSTIAGFTCAVLVDGTVQCFGYGGYGGLGNNSTVDSASPVTVSGINTALTVRNNCVLLIDGAVSCWGNNDGGQLGNGTTVDSLIPVSVSNITSAISIDSSGCAVLENGTIQCWGDSSINEATIPATVNGISTAQKISSGLGHTCALLTDGVVKCWGYNWDGQLGNGTTTDSLTPVTVSGITTAISVSAGDFYSCAILANGTVKCWGTNWFGRLGNGTTTDSLIPVTVSGITNAVSVSADDYAHTCAVLDDGTVKCWGANWYGQLGNGSTTDSLVPVTVSNLRRVVAVDVGGSRSCALLNDGYIQCWGELTEQAVSVLRKPMFPVYLP